MKWRDSYDWFKTPNPKDLFDEKDQEKALARELVLQKKSFWDGGGIGVNSKKYVHIMVSNPQDLMLYVVRQVLLVCQFPNFRDDAKMEEQIRTKATILVPNASKESLMNLYEDLKTEKYLGNLLDFCPHNIRMTDGENLVSSVKERFIGVEIEVVGLKKNGLDDYLLKDDFDKNAVVTIVTNGEKLSDEVSRKIKERKWQVYSIDCAKTMQVKTDLRRAALVNMVYSMGKFLKDISTKDAVDVKSYNLSLKSFVHHTSERSVISVWNNTPEDNCFSSLACADSIEYKLNSIGCDINASKKEMEKKVRENIRDLARTEHARWNVEKLIFGYKPYSEQESYEDEMIFGDDKKERRKELKAQKFHFDLCPYSTLRRIDFSSVKYDIFLVLAMPEILYKYKCTK